MGRTLRLVVGDGTADHSALTRLALAVADEAKRVGLSVVRIGSSRTADSGSRYLELRDRAGRPWLLRISNHRRPRTGNPNETPHFDLVSIDGRSGFEQACGWLTGIVDGWFEWFDPAEAIRQPRQKRRGRR